MAVATLATFQLGHVAIRLDRRHPVLRVRDHVPDRCPRCSWSSAAFRMPPATSPCATSPTSPSRRSSAPIGSASRSAPSRPSPAALIGFLLAYAAIARRAARLDPADAADLFRRRLQLCRRAAGLRLPGDARAHRHGDDAAGQVFRLQSLLDRLQSAQLLGAGAHLPLLPDPADGADADPGPGRAEARVARGLGDPGRQPLAVLALGRAAGTLAQHPGGDAAAVRQRLRRGRHRLRADRQLAEHRHHPALRPDPRRRPARPESRLRPGDRHDPDHRPVQRPLSSGCASAATGGCDEAVQARARGSRSPSAASTSWSR